MNSNLRRRPAFVLACLIGAQALAAQGYPNRQKIYPVGCEAYDLLADLYLARGLALPSSAGPWSADELARMFEALGLESVPAALLPAYSRLADLLYAEPAKIFADGLGAQAELELALEGYLHANGAVFGKEADWGRGFGDRAALAAARFEAWPGVNFYGYSELQLGMNSGNASGGANNLYAPAFGLNLPVSSDTITNIDMNFPYRAFVAAGGEHWSLQAGRDRLSWGSGRTGNLILGEQLRYHQALRFATYFQAFKFTSLASFFPHPQDYAVATSGDQNAAVNGVKLLLAHRFETRLLSGRLGLALNESIMYQSADNTLDLRVLNPLAVYHNYYIRGNANSILGAELDLALLPGLSLHAQAVSDDSASVGEPVQPEAGARPDARGYLAGLRGAWPCGGGLVTASLEGAYTDPFLYLREAYNDTSGTGGVGYDVALRVFNNGVQYLRDFVGYQYGNDALVGDLRLGYRRPGAFSFGAEAFLMLHGVMGLESAWGSYTGTETVPSTPSTANPFAAAGDEDASGPVETTLRLSLGGERTAGPRTRFYGRLDYYLVWNKDNVERSMVADPQLSLGVSHTLK